MQVPYMHGKLILLVIIYLWVSTMIEKKTRVNEPAYAVLWINMIRDNTSILVNDCT